MGNPIKGKGKSFKAGKRAGKKQQRRKDKGRVKGKRMARGVPKKRGRQFDRIQGGSGETMRRFKAPAATGFSAKGGGRYKGTYVSNTAPINIKLVGNATSAAGISEVWMYNVNPGLPPDAALAADTQSLVSGLSTRLSQEAVLYENHSLRRKGCHLTVKYVPNCSNQVAGEVIISYFRNNKTPFPSGGTARQQYLEQKHERGSVWKEHTMRVPFSSEDRVMKRVRNGIPTIPQNDGKTAANLGWEIDMYDDGYITVCLDGVANNQVCGNIEINYRWHLSGPTSVVAAVGQQIANAPAEADHWTNGPVGSGFTMPATVAFNLQPASYTGSLALKAGSSLITSLTSPVANTVNFLKEGLFNVFSRARFIANPGSTYSSIDDTKVASWTNTTAGGASILTDWDDGFSDQDTLTYNGAATSKLDGFAISDVVQVTALPASYNPSVQVNGNWDTNGANSKTQVVDIVISEVPNAFMKLEKYKKRMKEKKEKDFEVKMQKVDALLAEFGESKGYVKVSPVVKPLLIDEKDDHFMISSSTSVRSKSLPKK